MSELRIKVCGITTADDARACVELGVDWIGLNFVAGSPRRVDAATARAIADAVRGYVEIVGVVAGLDEEELVALRRDAALDRVQLHGDEPPELVRKLGSWAYKALRVGSADDVAIAADYPGLVLVDARVDGQLGGTGQQVDARLVATLARARDVVLAGGLRPDNVAVMVQAVRPWGVDVASGVEHSPGKKDHALIEAFVREVRQA